MPPSWKPGATRSRKRQEGLSLEPVEGVWPCQHLDFRLLSLRLVTQPREPKCVTDVACIGGVESWGTTWEADKVVIQEKNHVLGSTTVGTIESALIWNIFWK